jgi:hypothetical protein
MRMRVTVRVGCCFRNTDDSIMITTPYYRSYSYQLLYYPLSSKFQGVLPVLEDLPEMPDMKVGVRVRVRVRVRVKVRYGVRFSLDSII